jgi:hypothetical protein
VAPSLHQKEAAKQVWLNIERIEAAHVARGLDAMKANHPEICLDERFTLPHVRSLDHLV